MNNKRLTTLLVILVTLVLVQIILTVRLTAQVGNNAPAPVAAEQVADKETAEKPKSSSISSKTLAVRKIEDVNPGIYECKIGAKSYFKVPQSMFDGDDVLYDGSGTKLGSCGGGMRPVGSLDGPTILPECAKLTDCTWVYGMNPKADDPLMMEMIDVYHRDN